MKWSRSLSFSAAFAAALAAAPVLAQPAVSSVRVETVPGAAIVRAPLEALLRAAFTDRTGTHGSPHLVVRVTTLMLSANPSGGYTRGGRRGAGGDERDFLEGEALLLTPAGRVLSRTPLLVSQQAAAGGAWYLPDHEKRRVEALGAAYAGWLRRKLGS